MKGKGQARQPGQRQAAQEARRGAEGLWLQAKAPRQLVAAVTLESLAVKGAIRQLAVADPAVGQRHAIGAVQVIEQHGRIENIAGGAIRQAAGLQPRPGDRHRLTPIPQADVRVNELAAAVHGDDLRCARGDPGAQRIHLAQHAVLPGLLRPLHGLFSVGQRPGGAIDQPTHHSIIQQAEPATRQYTL